MICGPIGSGKSTVATFLASEMSVRLVSFGEFVRHLAQQSGLPDTREALQELGYKTYKSKGARGFLQGALQLEGVGNSESVIFDGVRHLGMMAEIRRTARKSVAIYLDVCQEKRFRRHQSRQSNSLPLVEFQAFDSHAVEAQTGNLKELCDLVIDASQPISEIQRSLLEDSAFFPKDCLRESMCPPH